MTQINDDDLPITVAGKIINGDEHASDMQDMFDIEEIKEIADYLMVYYQAHQNGD